MERSVGMAINYDASMIGSMVEILQKKTTYTEAELSALKTIEELAQEISTVVTNSL